MSIGKDILRLKEIVKEEQEEGKARLAEAGFPINGKTIEDVIDNIPSGSAFVSILIFEDIAPINEVFTAF